MPTMARRNRGEFERDLIMSIGKDATEAAKKALADGAQVVVDDAKSRVPVKTGALRNSIHSKKMDRGTAIKIVADAKDKSGVPYGQYVEFNPLINEPFMYPAMDAHREEIKQNIKNAIKEALKKYAKR